MNALSSSQVDDLTVEQLDELLTRKQLSQEQHLLTSDPDAVSTSAITASTPEAETVGSTLFIEVSIEGIIKWLID